MDHKISLLLLFQERIWYFMEKTVHLLIMYTMLVLTLLLFHKGRKHQRSLVLAIYASVEVVTNGLNSLTLTAGNSLFDQFPAAHFIYKPLYCLWVPLFYFYVRYCFSSNFKFNKKHLVHLLPFLSFLVFFLMTWMVKGNQTIWENLYRQGTFVYNTSLAVDLNVKLQYVIYISLMINSLLHLEKTRVHQPPAAPSPDVDIKWLRFIIYGYAFGGLTGVIYSTMDWINSPLAAAMNLVSISYFFLFFFILFYNTITHKLYNEEAKPKAGPLPDADMQLLMQRIEELVAGQKMFLDPELNLPQLALALNHKERTISQAINTIHKRNLNDYINSLRIEHACRLLQADKEKPVFQVMYESGFNTKGAFNLAFKKTIGKTPTQYREERPVE